MVVFLLQLLNYFFIFVFPMSIFGGLRLDGEGGSTWMSGLISGAGKVISSVFGSDDTQSSSSFSSYSDFDEEENTYVSFKGMDEHKQIEDKSEPEKDYNGVALAIISEIESKRAIEQLIKQETFSREEFYNRTEMIRSRVVGQDGLQKQLLDRSPGNATTTPGAWKSLNKANQVPETISISRSSLDVLSPMFSRSRTPDLRRSIVVEAKKWLEDKRFASCSDPDIHYESFSLNADLPGYSLKRNYLDSGLKDTFDEIRNIRHKATEKERIYHDSRNLSVFEYRDASSNLSLKLPTKGNCTVGALTLMDESVELSNPVRAGSIICVNLIPNAEGAVNLISNENQKGEFLESETGFLCEGSKIHHCAVLRNKSHHRCCSIQRRMSASLSTVGSKPSSASRNPTAPQC